MCIYIYIRIFNTKQKCLQVYDFLIAVNLKSASCYLFVCLFVSLFVCLFVCLFVRSFVRLFVRSFVCLSLAKLP